MCSKRDVLFPQKPIYKANYHDSKTSILTDMLFFCIQSQI